MARAFPSIPAGRRFAANGRWIPWIFVGGMISVVAVNAVLIFFAFSSWGGTVSSRAYERGLGYNRVLAAAARETALGWTVEALHRPEPDGRGTLVIEVLDAKGAPLAGQVSVMAQRPLEAMPPISVAMHYAGNGRYAGALAGLPKAGLWDFRIAVEWAGETAHFTRRAVVR